MESNKNNIFIITDSLGFNGWGIIQNLILRFYLRDNSNLKLFVFYKLENTFNSSIKLVNTERLVFVNFSGIYCIDYFIIKLCALVYKPFVIHFMSEPCANLIKSIKGSVNTKIVQTIHGTYGYLFLDKYKKFLDVIDSVIFNSDFTKKQFNISNSRLNYHVLFPLSTSFLKIENQIEFGNYGKENQLLFIGNSKERKGLNLVLKMFEILCKEFNDLKLIIVGNLNEEHIRLVGLNSNISFHNKVSESDLIKLISKSRVNLLPSSNVSINGVLHFEGYGLVHIESIKLGTPSVGCLNSGNESFIVDGVNGFLINQNDLFCLVDSTRKLINLGSNNQFYENVIDSIESINSVFYSEKIKSIYGI